MDMLAGDEPSIEDLLQSARGGSAEAVRTLVARSVPRLRPRIRLMMGPAAAQCADSEDFVQQVVVDALRGLRKFDFADERAFLAWLSQVARNNIRDEVRRKREAAFAAFSGSFALHLRSSASTTPQRAAERNERADRVADAIESLDPDHALVIELRHFDQLSFRQIAAQLDRTETAVERLHARALVALGRALREAAGPGTSRP